MEDLSPSDLKTILHSKRANIYYIEHCRILVNGGRVEYVTEEGKNSLYWNIPIANTTSLLLGTGTSVTQAAMRELAKEGMTMVIVTHEMGFAREVADRVIYIHQGEITEQGPPQQLFDKPQHERTQSFLARVLKH